MKELEQGSPVGDKRALPYGAHSEEDDTLNLRGLLSTLWRRRLLLIACVALSMALAVVVVSQLTPRYSAQALVLIEGGASDVANPEETGNRDLLEGGAVQSQAEILRSRELAKAVITRLELQNDPAFNQALRSEEDSQAGWNAVSLVPGWLSESLVWPRETQASGEQVTQGEEHQRSHVVDNFLDRLEVYTKGESRVVAVNFTAGAAEKAARIANTLAERYLYQQREGRLEAAKRAFAWLTKRVTELRREVEASETAVEQFRQSSGLLQGSEGVTLTSQRISDVNAQLAKARAAHAEAQARLRKVTELVESGQVQSAAEVLASGVIRDLQRQKTEIEGKLEEMSTEFGERHPAMTRMRAEARDLQAKLDSEIAKIVQGLENKASVAKAREASLEKSLNDLKQKIGAANQEQVHLRALEREAQANRALLETFLSRLKQISARADIASQQANARIISRAGVPTQPSFPKTLPILVLVLIGSGLAGTLLVFLTEHLSQGEGFRSGRQLERGVGLPVLALVPKVKRFAGIGKSPERYVLKRPASAFAESIRTLYTSIALIGGVSPATMLITSALPKEGKTAIAVCLARLHARAGHKVVIVDMDLRRPGVHQAFRARSTPGLTELLAERVPMKQALRTDKAVAGVDFISAGRLKLHLPEALSSDRLGELLDKLKRRYDLVIVDSPPVIPVADARILCSRVDTTVFVVHWDTTRRETVYEALNQLSAAGAHVAGTVLSMIDVDKQARRGYGDAAYASTLKRYYAG